MPQPQHIAFLPARKESVGFPGKNRLFFDRIAKFVTTSNLFDEVIVSTNDAVIKEKCEVCDFLIHHRSEALSGPVVSMKQVGENMIQEMNIAPDTYVWLIFINILYQNVNDFIKTKAIVEKARVNSLCSFVKAKSHPFDCWYFDSEKKKMNQYVENDAYRRQDKPPAWQHYHYLACFKAGFISRLNHELLSPETFPIFLDDETTKQLIEIDTPEEYEEWKERNAGREEILNS